MLFFPLSLSLSRFTTTTRNDFLVTSELNTKNNTKSNLKVLIDCVTQISFGGKLFMTTDSRGAIKRKLLSILKFCQFIFPCKCICFINVQSQCYIWISLRKAPLAYETWHTWSRLSGMGLDKQLLRLRRGGGTGAWGCVVIFGGSGGFTLPSSTRWRWENMFKENVRIIENWWIFGMQWCTTFETRCFQGYTWIVLKSSVDFTTNCVVDQSLHTTATFTSNVYAITFRKWFCRFGCRWNMSSHV